MNKVMKTLSRFTFRSFIVVLVAMASLLVVGCQKEEDDSVPAIDETKLVGKWQTTDGIFWRYDSDHNGRTWNPADDVSEDDETTMRFTWTVKGSILRHVFNGDEVGQAVVQDYRIRTINDTMLVWNDGLDDVTLRRIRVQ